MFLNDWLHLCQDVWQDEDPPTQEILDLSWGRLCDAVQYLADTKDEDLSYEVERRRRAERMSAKQQADRALLIQAFETDDPQGDSSIAKQYALEAEIRQVPAPKRDAVFLPLSRMAHFKT